ncbi:hypothetical protein JOB18_034616 [Solea senegalensis]|uniref:Uncharacterized protein n=1 Tax=Solea senegalensis TaxID=28829 RepID=A0AAV6PD79_SOLSE|nr:hypothetical protein JOB18_034616 [Solea senegalensis]
MQAADRNTPPPPPSAQGTEKHAAGDCDVMWAPHDSRPHTRLTRPHSPLLRSRSLAPTVNQPFPPTDLTVRGAPGPKTAGTGTFLDGHERIIQKSCSPWILHSDANNQRPLSCRFPSPIVEYT